VISAYLGTGLEEVREMANNSKNIEVKNLQVWYGPVHAVKGIDLSIKGGSITTILGAMVLGIYYAQGSCRWG